MGAARVRRRTESAGRVGEMECVCILLGTRSHVVLANYLAIYVRGYIL